MKKRIISFFILTLILSAALMCLNACDVKNTDESDATVTTDTYGYERQVGIRLSDCFVTSSYISASQLFGTQGESGLLSEKAANERNVISYDKTNYLTIMVYGKQVSENNYIGFSLVTENGVLYDEEAVTVHEMRTSCIYATLDMSKAPESRLQIDSVYPDYFDCYAIIIPFDIKAEGELYIDCAFGGFINESISAPAYAEDKEYAVHTDKIDIGYLSEEKFYSGDYSDSDITKEPSFNGGVNSYMVIDLTYTAITDNDGNQTYNFMIHAPLKGILDVTIEEAPTSSVTEHATTTGTTLSAAFTMPSKKGEKRDIRILLRLMPIGGGDATLHFYTLSSEDLMSEGMSHKTATFNTGEPTLNYVLNEDGISYTVKSASKSIITANIPERLANGLYVTAIAPSAFKDCKSLTAVNIPETVKKIGACAFEGCTSLQRLTVPFIGELADGTGNGLLGFWFGSNYFGNHNTCLPESVKSITVTGNTPIQSGTFEGCSSITDITFCAAPESIGEKAFYGCESIETIKLPSGVRSIGEGAFHGCRNLKTLVIPTTVESIGDSAFTGCKNLTFNSYNNANYLGSNANPYFVLVKASEKSITSCTVSEITHIIASSAFSECASLTDLTIPDGVMYISSSAFSKCTALKNVYIGATVKKIGELAFSYCSSLESLSIPDSTCEIGESVFYQCKNLKDIDLGNGIVTIGENAFDSCSALTSITLGNAIESIGNNAFVGCTSLQYNKYDNAYYIGNEANKHLVLVKADSELSCTISDTTRYICYDAFKNCALTSISIPPSVKFIGESAFYDCTGITKLTFSEGLIGIGRSAFTNCNKITELKLPDSLQVISPYSFYRCSALKSVYFGRSLREVGEGAFYYTYAEFLYIDDLSAYMKVNYKDFYANPLYARCGNIYLCGNAITELTVPNDIDTVLPYAFFGAVGIKSIILHSGITTIGSNAFAECENLTEVKFEEGVAVIDKYAFSRCIRLKKVILPNSIKSIGGNAFVDCRAIDSVIYNGTAEEWEKVIDNNSGIKNEDLVFLKQSEQSNG